MRVLIKTPFTHAKNINHGQQDENGCYGDDAQRHTDPVTAHALLARPKIAGVTVVAIIATAEAATMRNFAGSSTA